MKRIAFLLLVAISLLTSTDLMAQATKSIMRSSGRIYVVIAVLVIIFVGIALYLVRLDRKITRLEKDQLK